MNRWWSAAALVAALTSGGLIQEPSAAQETTPIFTCGQDETAPKLPLQWTNVVLAGDGRLYSPCPDGGHSPEHREVREAVLIREARFSGNPEARFRGAQALARNSTGINPNLQVPPFVADVGSIGGFITATIVRKACDDKVYDVGEGGHSRRWQPGNLFMMFRDGGPFMPRAANRESARAVFDVRDAIVREGAYALGTQLSQPGLTVDLVTAATRELRICYELNPTGALVPGLVMTTLGLTRYPLDNDVTATEDYLVQATYGTIATTFGAVKGLEVLQRQHPDHRMGDTTRVRLRQLLTYRARAGETVTADSDARIRRLALIALQRAGDRDPSALAAAGAAPDWQMRRLVAASLDLSDSQYGALGQQLASDPSFQVRYDMVAPIARLAARTGDCQRLVEYLTDSSPIVVMRAMDLLGPCAANEAANTRLILRAEELGKLEKEQWHIPLRALLMLARSKPALARPQLDVAVKHLTWQVRASAAALAATLGDEKAVLELVSDPEPNVQNAALDALFRLRSPGVVPKAIFFLENAADYQLLRTSAIVLRGVPPVSRNDAANALLGALERLTAQGSDTSKDTRIAILERLTEVLPPSRHAELLPFVVDVDEEVRKAAVKSYNMLMQTDPPAEPIKKRYPYQPRPEALLTLPSTAVLQLDSGPVTLRLLTDVAPVTVARFAALASQGYYNGRTFHRIVHNFIVQSGSPGDNDYAGVTRFMRDEFGPQGEHVRGAVGMSNRGPDKGDGQFFIDLVDLPHLDRTYTVFAYVTEGMELVDQLLEGARILKVTCK